MTQKRIKFEIATPERVVLKKDIFQITAPTKAGDITVLANHIPLISTLKPGVVEIINTTGKREVIAVSGGFIEVLRNKIVVLADTAEMAEEIDMEKAEEAKRRAEKLKEEAIHQDDIHFADITSQIEKELARTKAVKRWRRLNSIS